MTSDVVRSLAWLGLGLWVVALVLFFIRRDRVAAILQAVIVLPFIIAPAITLIKWRLDPTAYVRLYGASALRELPEAGVLIGLSLIVLITCGLALRGRRLWLIVPFLLNGVGVVAFFYFAYYFHVF
jgi:hypothetical protein